MKHGRLYLGILWIALLTVAAFGQDNKKIPSSEASRHMGERATVCGYVASTRYLSSSRSKPTFLNLGKAYPDQDITVVIWQEDRGAFGQPETRYLHRNICVSGQITSYQSRPQIIAKELSQIHEE